MDIKVIKVAIINLVSSTIGSIIGTYICFWGYNFPVDNLRRLIHWKRKVKKYVVLRNSQETKAGVPLTPVEGTELEDSRCRRVLHR